MDDALELIRRREQGEDLFLSRPDHDRTVLVVCHTWWADLIAQAIHRQGSNVLVVSSGQHYSGDDTLWPRYREQFDRLLERIRERRVELIVGGNGSALMPHPTTRELLHQAAGVPLVNYWWDEPRVAPPMLQRGFTIGEYIGYLRAEESLHLFWDRDVQLEMEAFFQLPNCTHLPLATTPAIFGKPDWKPISERPIHVSFLGHCAGVPEREWEKHEDPHLLDLARRTVAHWERHRDRPVLESIREVCRAPGQTNWFQPRSETDADVARAFKATAILDTLLAERNRLSPIRDLARGLGPCFSLIGKDWDQLGVEAVDRIGVFGPDAATIHVNSKLSLNTLAGTIHSAMPIRVYDTAVSNGLVFTPFTRELPDLFEPGRECVAFRDRDEMFEAIARVDSHPRDFEPVIRAGHERALAEHTWDRRATRLLEAVAERLDIGVPVPS